MHHPFRIFRRELNMPQGTRQIGWIAAVLTVIAAVILYALPLHSGVPMSSAQMTLACQHTEGPAWKAAIVYPLQGGWGWRCYIPGSPGLGSSYRDVHVEPWCLDTYGLHARGGSSAYNWRCDE